MISMSNLFIFIVIVVIIPLSIYSCSSDLKKAHKWCDARGYEVFHESRNGYRCKDPNTGLIYIPLEDKSED